MDLLGSDLPVLIGLITGAIGLWLTITKEWKHETVRRTAAMLTITASVLSFIAQIVQVRLDAVDAEQAKRASAQQAQAQRDRDAILKAIQGDVKHASSVVEHTSTVVAEISRRLEGVKPGQVGEPLISVSTVDSELERLVAFGKGSADSWQRYADWLTAQNASVQTVLTFDVNADNHYVLGLTLVYLLTSSSTVVRLRDEARSFDLDFIAQSFVDRALLEWRGVDYVLFRDGPSRAIIAYAPARDFTHDLVSIARTEGPERFERTLNAKHPDMGAALRALSPSIRTAAAASPDVASLVRVMLEKQWPECVLTQNGAHYLVSLEKMVRVADTSS